MEATGEGGEWPQYERGALMGTREGRQRSSIQSEPSNSHSLSRPPKLAAPCSPPRLPPPAASVPWQVNQHTTLLKWEGSDPSLLPLLLISHYDVVPVTQGTEGDWLHPPFSGGEADG